MPKPSWSSEPNGKATCARRISLIVFALVTVFPIATPGPAGALPAWSRKYEVSCTMCHTPLYPRLNLYGERFLANGYQSSDTEDGDTEGKNKLEDLLALDTNVGHWFAARLNVTPFQLETNAQTVNGELKDRITIGNTNWLQLFVAGSITKNISVYIENEITPDAIHQAWYYLGFHNLGGSPWLNFQAGRVSAVVFSPYPDRLPQLPAVGGGVLRVRSAGGAGEASIDIRSPRHGIQYYGWEGPVSLYGGITPGAKPVNPANNLDYWVGGRLFMPDGGPASLAGSSLGVHFEAGTDTRDAAGQNIENDFQRIMPGVNLRFRDKVDIQAAYVIGEDDNWALADTARSLDFSGVRAVGSWHATPRWTFSFHYDNFGADKKKDEDLLAEGHILFAPVVTWLWWQNFRLSFYPGFDLRDVDSEVKRHLFILNVRTAI